jgi:hypothetical protein
VILRSIALSIVLLTLLSCADHEGSVMFQTSKFRSEDIPSSWIPPQFAATIRSRSEYPREAIGSSLIPDFIKVYGMPDHFYRRTDPTAGNWGTLVYDLAEGYSIVVFIIKTDALKFNGGQLFRPNGEAEGPMIK